MFDLIKKTFLAGVGATVVTKERVESSLKDLVERGKLSAEDANKVATQIVDDGKREFEDARGKFEGALEDWLTKANFANKRDIAALAARIAVIEAKLGIEVEPVVADVAETVESSAAAEAHAEAAEKA